MLKVYANEITDWVIAESPEDAGKVMQELTGDDYSADDCGEWIQEDDSRVLHIWVSDDLIVPSEAVELKNGVSPYSSENSRLMSATCRQWADANGRCMLCSTEY